jgi:hypothetical protein
MTSSSRSTGTSSIKNTVKVMNPTITAAPTAARKTAARIHPSTLAKREGRITLKSGGGEPWSGGRGSCWRFTVPVPAGERLHDHNAGRSNPRSGLADTGVLVIRIP